MANWQKKSAAIARRNRQESAAGADKLGGTNDRLEAQTSAGYGRI
jgi:hypothetical protein